MEVEPFFLSIHFNGPIGSYPAARQRVATFFLPFYLEPSNWAGLVISYQKGYASIKPIGLQSSHPTGTGCNLFVQRG